MYVPKHQYKITPITNLEGRIEFEDGTPLLKGSIVELSNGDIYDVPLEDLQQGNFSRAKKLIRNNFDNITGTGLSLLKSFIARKKAGQRQLNRYFVRHKVVNKIVEVSEEEFLLETQNPQAHKELIVLLWETAGPVEDYQVNSFKYKGIKTKNREAVEAVNLTNYVTDYAFLADDEGKFEPFVERKPDQFYIPSPSKKVGL